jgi:outer membrane protein OmpA-like peptidoglycan-associated protein
VRAWAESRLGLDLSGVRIHDGADAHGAAAERYARAVTAGGDVVFAEGEYRPETPSGRELLLHELAHVAQQAERGIRAAQHDDAPRRTDGIGRTPPDADFAIATLPLTEGEDAHVLFANDRIDLDAAVVAERARRVFAGHSGAVVVSVHGYASIEGDTDYNVNLSAHRAVAVRDAIARVLPAGSVVNLIAHGATDVFGGPGQNRRVGLDVWDMPSPDSEMMDADRYLRTHAPLGFSGGLHLDPITLPPPPPSRTPAEVATAATERRHFPPITDTWIVEDPKGHVFGDPADPPAYLRPDPLSFVAPRVPWGLLSEDFQGRRLVLGEGDQAMILRHWQLYHPLARALYGIPVTRWFFDSPDDVMTSLTRKMISYSLAGDRPNAVELFDRELDRLGIPTPIYTPSFELRFDPDFRNWRRP